MAGQIGTAKAANVVMLDALLEKTGRPPTDTAIPVMEHTVKNPKLLALDKQAVVEGRDYVDTTVEGGAV
jgi:Pyruvate/2-oxoacid:ferredoxin oxidoreductase gamma subunit